MFGEHLSEYLVVHRARLGDHRTPSPFVERLAAAGRGFHRDAP